MMKMGPCPKCCTLHCNSALYLSICISVVYHYQIDEEIRKKFRSVFKIKDISV